MIAPFKKQIIKIFTTKHQILEAKNIAKLRNLPKGEVLHAILARDNETIMITRDKHFLKLRDVIESYKPEEII